MRRKQLMDRTKAAAAEFLGNGVGASRFAINYSKQTYRFSRSLQFVVHTGVIAPERTCSDNGYVDDGLTS